MDEKQLEDAERIARKFWRDQRLVMAKGIEERIVSNLTQLIVWLWGQKQ